VLTSEGTADAETTGEYASSPRLDIDGAITEARPIVDKASDNTIGRVLKKTFSSPTSTVPATGPQGVAGFVWPAPRLLSFLLNHLQIVKTY